MKNILSRRKFLKKTKTLTAAAIASGIVPTAFATGKTNSQPDNFQKRGSQYPEKNKTVKPNVLLIMTDQQTVDAMSCAGNLFLQTPAMDNLAADGIRFTNNYVTQPLCLPFRSSLQTARYPHEIKVYNNRDDIQGDVPLLGNLMTDAGYECRYFGKWHVGIAPDMAGYDKYQKGEKDHDRAGLGKEFLLQKNC